MRKIVSLCLACALIAVAGCTTNPATGQSAFTAFMSPEDEQRVGREEHPKLVKEFGGAYADAKLAGYVDQVGQALARTTEMPGLAFSFTVLDDEMTNAFALPGGYVHVTRGLLALADNEAEMAGVLAHEIGHVTARHSAQRYSQGVLAQIGAGILGIAGAAAGVPAAGDLAGFGAQAYLQGYSREQELEADMLGIRYMTRAGYDPQAMASFFRKLDRFTQLQATMAGDPQAAQRFSIMASHPRTGDRVAQAIQLAGMAPAKAARVDEAEFLSRIDGMVFGDSPEQGVRRGRDFAHPRLRIAFRVPPGFVMVNDAKQVTARGPGDSLIAFDADMRPEVARANLDPASYVTRVWGGKLALRDVETFTVNGMPGATATAEVRTRAGAPVDLRLVAVRERPDRLYRFMFLTPTSLTDRLSPEFRDTIKSFRRLSSDEAAAIKPLRLRVVTVRAGDTPERLAAGMPFDSHRTEMFLVLNGLRQGEPLQPGQKVKVITD